ncbi:MAG: hypothetical protein V3R29_12905 [Candidatus Acidoferrales bacterium]
MRRYLRCGSLSTLEREGFQKVYILSAPEAIDAVQIRPQAPPGTVRPKTLALSREAE